MFNIYIYMSCIVLGIDYSTSDFDWDSDLNPWNKVVHEEQNCFNTPSASRNIVGNDWNLIAHWTLFALSRVRIAYESIARHFKKTAEDNLMTLEMSLAKMEKDKQTIINLKSELYDFKKSNKNLEEDNKRLNRENRRLYKEMRRFRKELNLRKAGLK